MTTTGLKDHIVDVNKTMVKKMKCPLCPKEYQSERKLKRHCKKIHGMTYEDAVKLRRMTPLNKRISYVANGIKYVGDYPYR